MLIRCEYTRLVPISELKPNPQNENAHSQEQITHIAEVLLYQGFRKPIVVSNRSGLMVTGHCTRLSAMLNNWTEVPVSFQDFDDEDQETAHRIADNALANQALLDFKKVNAQIPKLSPDFNIRMFGIKSFGIDPNFEPSKEEQPNLDQQKPMITKCPNCGECFDARKNISKN